MIGHKIKAKWVCVWTDNRPHPNGTNEFLVTAYWSEPMNVGVIRFYLQPLVIIMGTPTLLQEMAIMGDAATVVRKAQQEFKTLVESYQNERT